MTMVTMVIVSPRSNLTRERSWNGRVDPAWTRPGSQAEEAGVSRHRLCWRSSRLAGSRHDVRYGPQHGLGLRHRQAGDGQHRETPEVAAHGPGPSLLDGC